MKKRTEYFKTRAGLFACVLLVGLTAVVIVMFIQKGRVGETEIGKASGKSALEALAKMAGSSYVETLADLNEAAKQENPGQYLSENSVFVMDNEAIEKFTEAYLTGAESSAQAEGITTEDYIKRLGYEDLDVYREEVRAEALSFLKCRLAVYTAAEKKKIKIGTGEYKRKLQTYASKFSYNTEEEFVYACEPASIANEMLYDKTMDVLQGRGNTKTK